MVDLTHRGAVTVLRRRRRRSTVASSRRCFLRTSHCWSTRTTIWCGLTMCWA